MNNKPLTASQRASIAWHGSEMNAQLLHDFAQYQLAQGLAIATVRNRASILATFGRFVEIPLIDAGLSDMRSYLARGTVKPGSLRIERATFRAFYGWAVEDGLIDQSPAEKLAPVKVPRRQPRPFTLQQIQRMLNSGAYRRTRAMIAVGYYQGFRVSQIAAIHARDIDFSADTIRTIAKGSKERHLPLHPEIRALAYDMPRNNWWFPSPNGGHIKPASVTDAIGNAIRRAGITDPKLTPHSLRHSFGSELVDAGVDIRVVQELMLHEDLSTTQIYTRVSDSRKRAGIELLDGLVLPAHSTRGSPRISMIA